MLVLDLTSIDELLARKYIKDCIKALSFFSKSNNKKVFELDNYKLYFPELKFETENETIDLDMTTIDDTLMPYLYNKAFNIQIF